MFCVDFYQDEASLNHLTIEGYTFRTQLVRSALYMELAFFQKFWELERGRWTTCRSPPPLSTPFQHSYQSKRAKVSITSPLLPSLHLLIIHQLLSATPVHSELFVNKLDTAVTAEEKLGTVWDQNGGLLKGGKQLLHHKCSTHGQES